MTDVDKVRVSFAKARELVARNEPREARVYVLKILQIAYAGYKSSTDTLSRAKTAVFLKKWLAVSQDLYSCGVTDYVKECFGLLDVDAWIAAHPGAQPKREEVSRPAPSGPASNREEKDKRGREEEKPPEKRKNRINFDGLFGDDADRGKSDPWMPSKRAEIPDYSRMLEEESKLLDLPAEIFSRVTPALVELRMQNLSSGTGFIISDKGYLLTNSHVVLGSRGALQSGMMSFIGRNESYPIEIVRYDKSKDVALCRFDPAAVGNFSVIRFIEDYSNVLPGSFCMIAGNTNGIKLNPISGNVRDPRTAEGDLTYAAPTNPGDSGGPVLNRRAECIGINKSKMTRFGNHKVDQVSNATPSVDILHLLATWGITKNDLTRKGV